MPTPAAPSTQPGNSGCATSTRRRTTGSASRSGGSEPRSPRVRASDYVLSSKVGRMLEPVDIAGGLDDQGFVVPATHRRRWDFSRDGIRRSLEESLERLGLDRLDIVYLHDPDEHWTEVLATGYAALEELRSEGIVAAIGAGMNQSTMLADLVRETDLDVVMLAGRYTLLEQDALDDLLPLCCERRVAVVAAGVFNSGLLARESRPSNDASTTTASAPLTTRRARAGDRARLRAARDDASGRRSRVSARATERSQVFASAHGRRSKWRRNEVLYGEPIASDLWSELKAEGLIREDAPVPD